MYYFGLGKSLGMIDNTDIAWICADGMGLSLEDASGVLFQRADSIFPSFGVQWSVDSTDPVIHARKGPITADIPVNKSVMRILYPGGTIEIRNLKGFVVLAPKTGRYYLPSQVLSPFVWNWQKVTPDEEALLDRMVTGKR